MRQTDKKKYSYGLSIVIPCYNAGKSIVQCIESIPDTCDTEIIIVDDCSKDDSVSVIEDYIQTADRNIIFEKNASNKGAGETRNIGIKRATKEYLTFLDSDDQFDETIIEEIAKPIDHGYDMIVFDAYIVSNKGKELLEMFFLDSTEDGEIDQKKALVFIKGCTCGKVYRTETVKQNNIKFGCIPRNEDVIFTKVATSYSQRVYYIKKPLYYYYANENSLMNDESLIDSNNSIVAFKAIFASLHNRGFEDELNSMYFLEVLYSVTVAEFKKGNSGRKAGAIYRRLKSEYKKPDKYFKYYSKKFRITYLLFEMKAFGLYKMLQHMAS